MTVRLYGRSVGNGSLSVVTAGFREALLDANLLEGEVSLDRTGGSEEEHGPPGALANDGVFTGNLGHTPLMQQSARHNRDWVQVTPNSSQIPKRLLEGVLRLPNVRILSASSWGSSVIAANLLEMGCHDIPPILTVHHGVSGFAPSPADLEVARSEFNEGCFRVVHFSTSGGQRKGTFELVQAWRMLRERQQLSPKATLTLVLDFEARKSLIERLADAGEPEPSHVFLRDRMDADAAAMSKYLSLAHLVCTPSRGEGFGLTPLQARACGVPVATTTVTGHSAGHCCGPGVVRISTGDQADIDDGPGALAPLVCPSDIMSAIHQAFHDWHNLSQQAQAAAPIVAEEWSWKKQLAPLIEQLKVNQVDGRSV